MALTKVIGNGLGTLGDGTANDTKIVFDGNAQDFHIGLDDSSDSLTMGLGSTLGTTSHMVFDANGHITKPLQSAFLATLSGNQLNLTADGSLQAIQFNTEIFDQNADFNTSNYTFTAPVTGRYHLSHVIYAEQIDSAANYTYIVISTSNRNVFTILTPKFSADAAYWYYSGSLLLDMDASDTASLSYVQGTGDSIADINQTSYFSGYLVC